MATSSFLSSLESTSTTSCMSDTVSGLDNEGYDHSDDGNYIKIHLGDFDGATPVQRKLSPNALQLYQLDEEDEVETSDSASSRRPIQRETLPSVDAHTNNRDDIDVASTTSSDDESMTYDSVMEEIRKDIWEQVKQAKFKKQREERKLRKNKKASSTLQSTRKSKKSLRSATLPQEEQQVVKAAQDWNRRNRKVSDESSPPVTTSTMQKLEPEVELQAVSEDYTAEELDCVMADRLRVDGLEANFSILESQAMADQDEENVMTVRDSINLLRTARNWRWIHPVPHPKRRLRPPSPSINAPFDESSEYYDDTGVWDIQDDLGTMIVDENDVKKGLRELDAANKEKMDGSSTSWAHFQVLQEVEVDSVFESILAINLEDRQENPISTKNDIILRTIQPASLPEAVESDVVLEAKVHGSREETILYIPVSLIEKREIEMRKLAFARGIGHDQWTRSLLYRKLRNHNIASQNGVVAIQLDPETDCAKANYSHSFQWQSWLNECIESFYKSGSMRIPDFCIGPDILVALQYFGILYTPDQLDFDSFVAYLRVKLWSEYFTHRGTIAAWLAGQLDHARPVNDIYIFSTSPYPAESGATIWVENRKARLFDGGISLSKKMFGSTSSSAVVYSYFNENDEEDESSNIDVLMREDFCNFLRQLVPGLDASFPVKSAIISHSNGSCENIHLAALYVQFKSSSPNQVKEIARGDEESNRGRFRSDASDTSRAFSISPKQPKLMSCQIFDSSSLKPWILRVPELSFSESDETMSKDPSTWVPAKPPELVLPSSLFDFKDSHHFFDRWMSADKMVPEGKSTIRAMVPEDTPLPVNPQDSWLPEGWRPAKKIPPKEESVGPAMVTVTGRTSPPPASATPQNSGLGNGWMCANELPPKQRCEVSAMVAGVRPLPPAPAPAPVTPQEFPLGKWWTWEDVLPPIEKEKSEVSVMITGATPLPPLSGTRKSRLLQVEPPPSVDEIYADLLLQDTEFFDIWEKRVLARSKNQNPGQSPSPYSRQPNRQLPTEATSIPRQHQAAARGTAQFIHGAQKMDYKAKEFVCDVVQLFEASDGDDASDSNNHRPTSRTLPGGRQDSNKNNKAANDEKETERAKSEGKESWQKKLIPPLIGGLFLHRRSNQKEDEEKTKVGVAFVARNTDDSALLATAKQQANKLIPGDDFPDDEGAAYY